MAKTSSLNMAVVAQNVLPAHINKLAADVDELYGPATAVGGSEFPFTIPSPAPTIMRLFTATSPFTFGSTPVASNGYFTLGSGFPWGAGYSGTQTLFTESYSVFAEAITFNRLFLLPAHGALTITALDGTLVMLISTSGARTLTWTKTEILLCKISETGVETTLATNTVNHSGYTHAGSGANNPNQYCPTFSISYGAGYSLLATERLAIRIKAYGSNTSSATSPSFTLNGAVVPLNSNIIEAARQTTLALYFA